MSPTQPALGRSLWLVLPLLLGLLAPAAAQQPAPQPPQPAQQPATQALPTPPSEHRAAIDALRGQLEAVERGLQAPLVEQETLVRLRGDLDPLMDKIRELAALLEPLQREANERLTQIGPRPTGDGQTEAPEITRQRETTRAEFTRFDADLRQTRLLLTRAEQVSERLADRRRELLTRQLFERSASVLDPDLWRDVGRALPRLGSAVGYYIADWFGVLGQTGHALGFVVLGLTVALAVVVYGPLRRRLMALPQRFAASTRDDDGAKRMERSLVAIWTAIVNGLLPAIAVFIIVRVLTGLDLLPFRFAQVANAIVLAVVVYSSLRAVALATLSPLRPDWRAVPVSDQVAQRAVSLAGALAVVVGVFQVMQAVNAAIVAPFAATVALLGLRCLAVSAVLLLGLAALARLESAEREERAKDPYAGPRPHMAGWRWMRFVLWVAAIVIGGAGIFGYGALGAFVSGQVTWVLLVAGGLVLLLNLIDDVISQVTRAGSVSSRKVAMTLGIETNAVEQFGIVISGVLRVILITIATFMVIAPWGVDSRDAVGAVRALFFGVQIGGITISLSHVLLGVTMFAVGLFVTRGIQRWLDDRLLPATRMDIGLRNSIRTVFGYAGFIVAAMVGFSFLGVDLQNLAIVAGALSVGIGFGLQSIVSNFVSGLILLAERPIKAGDWIVVGDQEGYVRRINVRSTEIETFDKAVVILPNSNLVGGTVKNWMHNDLLGRAKVKVGVNHGTDPEMVKALLIEIASAHPVVTCDPAPLVSLVDITDTGLFFEVGCTVTNVDRVGAVRSDLRFEIVRRFTELGVEFR